MVKNSSKKFVKKFDIKKFVKKFVKKFDIKKFVKKFVNKFVIGIHTSRLSQGSSRKHRKTISVNDFHYLGKRTKRTKKD